MQFRCPNCRNPIRVNDAPVEETFKLLSCPSCNSKISFSDDATETMSIPSGQMIAHYEIKETLGSGSFGTVYKAWDTELQRGVAIKVPRYEDSSAEMTQGFLREARSAASVSHPNVVAVYELGQYKNSVYIACELIEGVSLNEFLKLEDMTHKESAAMMIKLLRAAEVFHQNGVIHRDLKPGNILIDKNHEPHIADFGLARRESSHEVTVTQSGKIVGTPAFMSPEQAGGENSKITALSDIYAMGVILFVMLTGKRPFKATDTRTLLFAIMSSDPPFPRTVDRGIHRDLETICLKAMSKPREQRYGSAGEMADDLQRFISGEPIVARPVSKVERLWKKAKRYPIASSAIALSIALLASLTIAITRIPPINPELIPQAVSVEVMSEDAAIDEAKVKWAIARLNPNTREPVQETTLRQDGTKVATTELIPGEYLFVVSVEGLGFHEVIRTVPLEPDTDELQPIYPHQRWKYDDSLDVTFLPPITVRDLTAVTGGMVKVPSGDFEMGRDGKYSARFDTAVEEFFVDPTEVSKAVFEADGLQKDPTSNPGDFAAAGMSWHAAVQWAERAGKRLLSETEFEYLATNLGQGDYPSDQLDVYKADLWIYGPVGQPAADRLEAYQIYGLHSNVAEWTSSTPWPNPGVDLPSYLLETIPADRVVRGGPFAIGTNDRKKNTWKENARYRAGVNVNTNHDEEVGFRCGLSSQPRFIEQ